MLKWQITRGFKTSSDAAKYWGVLLIPLDEILIHYTFFLVECRWYPVKNLCEAKDPCLIRKRDNNAWSHLLIRSFRLPLRSHTLQVIK